MKVLVSGGAGFIGSHVCEAVLNKGYDVLCIDNLCTGNKKNIEHLLNDSNFKFIEHDVTKPIDLKVDFIFHLASPASPVDYQKLPVETSMANSIGTYNILQLALKNNARFLLASTSEVYGDPIEHPQKETYWGNVNPFGVRSCYDESKRFAEALTMSFHRKYNLDVRIARIFNTYGPRMRLDDGRVIPNFIVQAISQKPITVYGNGRQTRSFCFISDMVGGLMKFMFIDGLSGEVINLGSTDERKIIYIAEILKKLINSKSDIVFKPLPEDDPTKRKPDITKAKKVLGWETKVDLKAGLTKTIDWFVGELNK
jgi:nucleoside-diphosphate-sugar epimerase